MAHAQSALEKKVTRGVRVEFKHVTILLSPLPRWPTNHNNNIYYVYIYTRQEAIN